MSSDDFLEVGKYNYHGYQQVPPAGCRVGTLGDATRNPVSQGRSCGNNSVSSRNIVENWSAFKRDSLPTSYNYKDLRMQEIHNNMAYPRTQRPMMNTYRQISRFNRKLTCLRDVIPCSDSKISSLLLPRMAPPAFDTHEDINRRYSHQPQHSLAHRPRPAAETDT